MRWLLAIVLLATTVSVTHAEEPPSYLILRAPARPHDAKATQGYYPGRGYGVEAQAYNYGWFGAKPGKTWQRSFGYHRNYTQWKAR